MRKLIRCFFRKEALRVVKVVRGLNSGGWVDGIAPGPTATPMLCVGEVDDYSLPGNPSGRWAHPTEIATMAVMLESDAGRMVVGDILYMTGGAGTITQDDIKFDFS